MAERHPSRTLLLVPRPEEEDGIDARALDALLPGRRPRGVRRGDRADAARRPRRSAGVDRAAAARSPTCRCSAAGAASRRSARRSSSSSSTSSTGSIVDSSEWGELPLRRPRASSSSAPRSRTSPGRARRVAAPSSRATGRRSASRRSASAARAPRRRCCAGWLGAAPRPRDAPRSRQRERARRPPRRRRRSPPRAAADATPSDLLSAELDRFGRDPIYEEAVAPRPAAERLTRAQQSANRLRVPLGQVSETICTSEVRAYCVRIHARALTCRHGVRSAACRWPIQADRRGRRDLPRQLESRCLRLAASSATTIDRDEVPAPARATELERQRVGSCLALRGPDGNALPRC